MTNDDQQSNFASVLFHYWRNPGRNDIGQSATEFLHRLPGPSHIHLTGKDRSTCRVVVTLLHGNEPSGLFALFHLLQQQIIPRVDIHIFIPSVAAAQRAPGFHYRMLPGHKDLNRCFNQPTGNSPEDRLAEELLRLLKVLCPEAVIDIHNTSGSGPSFGVTTFKDERHDALVSLFTQRLIVTNLSLGALMETSDTMIPTVTIECGGADDPESNLMATEGMTLYVMRDDVLVPPSSDFDMDYFYNPVRLELKPGSKISYGDHASPAPAITLLPEVEHYNFGFVPADTRLGFVAGVMEEQLTVKNSAGEDLLADFFQVCNGELRTKHTLKLFMVTTNPEIARTDCLFYMVKDKDR